MTKKLFLGLFILLFLLSSVSGAWYFETGEVCTIDLPHECSINTPENDRAQLIKKNRMLVARLGELEKRIEQLNKKIIMLQKIDVERHERETSLLSPLWVLD